MIEIADTPIVHPDLYALLSLSKWLEEAVFTIMVKGEENEDYDIDLTILLGELLTKLEPYRDQL